MKRLLAGAVAGLSLYAAAGLAMASGEPVTRLVTGVWADNGRQAHRNWVPPTPAVPKAGGPEERRRPVP